MPKMRIEFLQAAWKDVERIADFYLREVGPVSAERVMDEMLEMIEILAAHPFAGSLHPDLELARQEYRKLVLTKTYVAIYKVNGDTVTIYRIVNGATDYPRLLR